MYISSEMKSFPACFFCLFVSKILCPLLNCHLVDAFFKMILYEIYIVKNSDTLRFVLQMSSWVCGLLLNFDKVWFGGGGC